MAAKYEIEWSEEASADVETLYNFLLLTWGERKAEEFLDWYLSLKKLFCATLKLLYDPEKSDRVISVSFIRIPPPCIRSKEISCRL
jgi:plasmid stabilization system protein ParE